MITPSGRYYLYRHIRFDKNQPFYIGIGTKTDDDLKYGYYTRANIKNGRTKYWKNITTKSQYKVEILLESDNISFIKEKEIEFIKLYGRIDNKTGILTNLTDGGDGTTNCINKNKIKVYEFSQNGDFIKEWDSITEVAKYFNIGRPLMTRTLRLNSKGCFRKINGNVFQYENYFIPKIKNKHHISKIIHLYDNKGNLLNKWDSLKDCLKELNLYAEYVRENMKGNYILCKNAKDYWRFKYIKE